MDDKKPGLLPLSELTAERLEEIETRFTYHAPHGDQAQRYQYLREKAKEFAVIIAQHTPLCREQSLALTYLDSVVMLANAAIARREKKKEE